MPMLSKILCAYLLLLQIDLRMRFGKLRSIRALILQKPVRVRSNPHKTLQVELCRAMDLACVFYFKHVRCLQRSTATTLSLRSHGFEAEMVIGVQMLPFKSHAWVEVEGAVVNDKPYMPEIYQPIERLGVLGSL
jgi:Transglutaminase-like superfamily